MASGGLLEIYEPHEIVNGRDGIIAELEYVLATAEIRLILMNIA